MTKLRIAVERGDWKLRSRSSHEAKSRRLCKGEQEGRDSRAKEWRRGRAKLASYDEPTRKVIQHLWNDAPYPADPGYFNGMLYDIEHGRIPLDKPPPWRPTEEEIRIGREKLARFSERLKAEQAERAR
jgi:hypothetical protein